MTTVTRCNTYWYRYLQLIFAIAVVLAIRGVLQNDEVDSVEVSGILNKRSSPRISSRFRGIARTREIATRRPLHAIAPKITPFRAGWPAKCPNSRMTRFHRGHSIDCTWLGILDNLRHTANVSYPKHYDKGVNFQCPGVVMDHFGRASQLLTNRFQADLSTSKTNLVIKKQQAMHISLSYLVVYEKIKPPKRCNDERMGTSTGLLTFVSDSIDWNAGSNILIQSPTF